MEASTNGLGRAVQGMAYGKGTGGYFVSSGGEAVYANTSNGYAVHGVSQGSGGAALFENTYYNTTKPALWARTSQGWGNAAFFEKTSTTNPYPTLAVKNSGGGYAGAFVTSSTNGKGVYIETKGGAGLQVVGEARTRWCVHRRVRRRCTARSPARSGSPTTASPSWITGGPASCSIRRSRRPSTRTSPTTCSSRATATRTSTCRVEPRSASTWCSRAATPPRSSVIGSWPSGWASRASGWSLLLGWTAWMPGEVRSPRPLEPRRANLDGPHVGSPGVGAFG